MALSYNAPEYHGSDVARGHALRKTVVIVHETRFRVRYAETDQMGVVYYANYLIWMEVGRAEYCRASGIRYKDMETADGIRLAVVDAHCRYLRPARYDDEIAVKTWIARANRRMIEFHYKCWTRKRLKRSPKARPSTSSWGRI